MNDSAVVEAFDCTNDQLTKLVHEVAALRADVTELRTDRKHAAIMNSLTQPWITHYSKELMLAGVEGPIGVKSIDFSYADGVSKLSFGLKLSGMVELEALRQRLRPVERLVTLVEHPNWFSIPYSLCVPIDMIVALNTLGAIVPPNTPVPL